MARFLSQLKKKNLSVDIHPRAIDAYRFYHSQAFLFDKTHFKIDALKSLQHGQIFSAIHSSSSKCFLFGGFEVLGFSVHQFDIMSHTVIVYDDLEDDEIELIAWMGVMRSLTSTVQNSQLELLRKSINVSAPDTVLQKIFTAKKLTQRKLAECTALTVSGLKKQHKINPVDQQVPDVNLNIFEKVINGIGSE
ncbi:hypothetical protein P7F88_03810 [Vibrio hannami]|uniref:hypothetical protein n=1 Tax=Vibrio hannami TaxID=2717094 RepID=UPI00240EE93D|nr:hypothetical protein [Vibrio hannami]MDG3085273.1 hypothetical protein [Vibrio hannami]